MRTISVRLFIFFPLYISEGFFSLIACHYSLRFHVAATRFMVSHKKWLMKFPTNRWNIKEINQDLEFFDAAPATQTRMNVNICFWASTGDDEGRKKKRRWNWSFQRKLSKNKIYFYLRQNHMFNNTIFIVSHWVCTQFHFHVYNSLPTMAMWSPLFLCMHSFNFELESEWEQQNCLNHISYISNAFFRHLFNSSKEKKLFNAKTGKSITNKIPTKNWEMYEQEHFISISLACGISYEKIYAFRIVILFPLRLTMCILHFIFHFFPFFSL